MKSLKSIVICIAFSTIAAQSASAILPLSARELMDHCTAYPDAIDSTDGQYCVRYIQGFVDGAVATDERVMLNVEARQQGKETFAERAFRTRNPSEAARMRAALYAGYCLGEPVPLREVVGKVVSSLSESSEIDGETLAREAVYASLRDNYPCKTQDPAK